MKRVILLGPDAANGSESTCSYFRACASQLGRLLDDVAVVARSPGTAQRESMKAESRAAVRVRNFVRWPLRLRRLQADAFHIVDQGLAWYGTFLRGGLRLVTVHDLINYLVCAGRLPFRTVSAGQRLLVSRGIETIRNADHVFAISGFTASALIREAGVDAARITVTPNFVNPHFELYPQPRKTEARARLFGRDEFVVACVGNRSEYKNRLGALKVFDALRRKVGGARMHVTGGTPTAREMSFIAERGLAEAVHFWGRLPLETLVSFYNAADALIYTSTYEGFGLPPLEAMSCGCPVVSTTCASLREVVGEAALTVDDPSQIERLAGHLESVLKDESLRDDLRARGIRQAGRFTLQRSMRGIAEVYRRMLG